MIFRRYFVWAIVLLTAFVNVNAQKENAVRSNGELTMLVGTYTEGSTSKGVYLYRFNQNSGTAKMVSSVKVGNPSYIVATDNNKYAYSVSEYDNGKQAAVAYRLDKVKGRLTVINSRSTTDSVRGGENPCFLLTNGRQVVTANYTGGDITVFPVAKDGSLLPLSQRFSFKGNAPGVVAHLHCVRLSPDGKYLFADDLGNDYVYRFDVNVKADYENKIPFLTHCIVAYRGAKGMGPRHLAFSSDGRFAYLINELGGIVVAFGYNNGRLVPIQTIMADEGNGHGSADIHISPDGRFLYTSHRLKNDGVAIFRVNKSTGKLTKIGYQHTGIHPRNFNITPNGKYLLVACRDSNTIEIYLRNKKTGLLMNTGKHIDIGKPVCLQFLK